MPENRMYEEIRIRCGNVWFLFFWKIGDGREKGRQLSKIDGKMALWGKEGIHLKRYLFICQNISLDNEFHIKKFWNFPMKM